MKHIFLVILISILISSCSYHHQIIKTYPMESFTNLTSHALVSKRIVMLGDNDHGNECFENMSINILNAWLDTLERNPNDSSAPTKLFLILEADSLALATYVQVIENAKVEDYLEYAISGAIKYGGWEKLSIDNIKFYWALRSLKERIEKLNARTGVRKIDLQIKGEEGIVPWDYSLKLKMGRVDYERTTFMYFATKRDRITSSNIVKLLEQNKDYKALLFYGGAHLSRGRVDKTEFVHDIRQMIHKPIKDYYLAHFLDNKFGRNQIAIFQPFEINDTLEPRIDQYKIDKYSWDYFMHIHLRPYFPFSLYLANSQLFLQAIAKLIDESHNSLKPEDQHLFKIYCGLFSDHIYRSYLNDEPGVKNKIDSLMYLAIHRDADNYYPHMKTIIDSLIRNFDAAKNIAEMDKWIISPALPHTSLYYENLLKCVLYNLPSDTLANIYLNERKYSLKRNELDPFELNQIKKRIKELKVYYAIQMLWISTPEETTKLINYLQELTGQKFINAYQWNVWWENTNWKISRTASGK